jgi:hypothetical protein
MKFKLYPIMIFWIDLYQQLISGTFLCGLRTSVADFIPCLTVP